MTKGILFLCEMSKMTIRADKQRQKREKYLREKELQKKSAMRCMAREKILRSVFLVLCILSILLTPFLPEDQKLFGILAALWLFSFSAWTNWRISPNGTCASVVQVGKSGMYKPIYYRNLSVALVSSVISIILTIITIDIIEK